MAEDETVGWHQHLSGHEFEQALGVVQGRLYREAWCAAVHGVTQTRTRLKRLRSSSSSSSA